MLAPRKRMVHPSPVASPRQTRLSSLQIGPLRTPLPLRSCVVPGSYSTARHYSRLQGGTWYSQYLVDAVVIHIHHFEPPAPGRDMIAYCWQPAKRPKHVAGSSVIV